MTDIAENADIRINDFCIFKRLEQSETTKEIVGILGYKALEKLIGIEYKNFSDV